MEPHWSTRQTFERYLYDYFVKRNMHHTAEVFRKETNLPLNPAPSSSDDAMDVPQGFLLEWWSLNNDFDFFRQMHETHGLGGMQGYNAFQEVGRSMNVEAMYRLPDNLTPVQALNIGSNLMPSHVTGELPLFSSPSAHQEVKGELSQFIFPFSHQELCGELQQLSPSHQEATLTPANRTIEVSNVNGSEEKSGPEEKSDPEEKSEHSGLNEETDQIIENLLNSFWMFEQDQPNLFEKPTVGEYSRNVENLLECGDGNTGVNAIAGSPAALEDDDNRSDTSDCASNLRIIIADADASKDNQLESKEET